MPVTIICKNCGEETEIIPSKLNITKFCCKECWKEYLVTHPVNRHAARKYERGAEVHRKPGKKRPKDGLCKVCGRKLGEYNETDQCHHHSVLDPYQNEDWHPDGVKGGVAYDVGLVW
jgi:hypothetical protein